MIEYIGILTFILFLVLLYIYLRIKKDKSILIACIVCFFLTGGLVYGDKDNIQPRDDKPEISDTHDDNSDPKADIDKETTETKPDNKNSKYLTKIQWADTSNYMFAVEIDDFDGDIVQSGKYNFTTTGKSDESHVAIVWDIYISDNLYSNMRELSDSEYVTSVGGNDNTSASIILERGKYIYINYNKTALNPSGLLNIEIVK